MAIEISHDGKTKKWSASYKSHAFVSVGKIFITVGLAMLTGPWWAPIVFAVLEMENIPASSTGQAITGIVLVLIGLALVWYKYYVINLKAKETIADKSTYAAHPLSFDLLRQYLDTLRDDHSFFSSLDTSFHDSFTHFMRPENSFRTKVIAEKYSAYVASARKLHSFVDANFDVFPDDPSVNSDYRYCMRPELNIDRAMKIYNEENASLYARHGVELSALIAETYRSLNALSEELKANGCV